MAWAKIGRQMEMENNKPAKLEENIHFRGVTCKKTIGAGAKM